MEQGVGVIEPLGEGEWQSGEDTATSDYDPSIAESRYGSLTSSVNDHIWEYGRRYHTFREGRYPIPNDDLEYNREYMRHAMFKEILEGKLFVAPIGNHPQKIADLGTGFGDWAIEMGEMFPSAKVVGVDLSPIQPVWIPPNVEFVVDDIEDEWVQDSDFDFIHLRYVSIALKDNTALFRRIFENLKPGGWVESAEMSPHVFGDHTVKPDSALVRFYELGNEVLSSRYGFEVEIADSLQDLMLRTGFINVRKRTYNVPIGGWAKEQRLRVIGRLMKEVSMDLCVAMAARPFIEHGMEEKEREELRDSVKAALNDRTAHAQVPIHIMIGQKPPLSANPSTSSFGSGQQQQQQQQLQT
ncbi:S-adenosyl-L-methionine-dependent methyltransferase [Copromyces sp. CBS 386.78]|nr:S-adenosyl-L-methionine-dependent methyltransferase [Copromyces sp. CBS 386.78]